MSTNNITWQRSTPDDSGVLIGSNLLALKIDENHWNLSQSFPLGWDNVFPSMGQSFQRYSLLGETQNTLKELRYYSEKVIREFVLHNPEYCEKNPHIKDCFPYHVVSNSYSIIHYSSPDIPALIEGRRLYSGQTMYWEIKKVPEMIQWLQGDISSNLKNSIEKIEKELDHDH